MSRVRFDEPVLTDVSALNTASVPVQMPGAVYAELIITFGAGTSAGSFVLEESDDPLFAGTWALLETVAWAAVSSKVIKKVVGPFKYLRVRASVGVVGGTASARLNIIDN